MKTVITGARGFIGRSLIERLSLEKDFEILGLSRSAIAEGTLSLPCSWAVTDYSIESLDSVLDGADVVIHLAGIKGTKTELSDYDEDMQMLRNLLSVMSEKKIHRLIYASSRLVYGNPDTIPWTEETIPEPRLAYAKNKLRCEALCADWAKSGLNNKVLILRIAQVLGEGEETRNMINIFQETAKAGGELKVIGKSIAKRQYIYTKDLAEIIYRLLNSNSSESGLINVGMVEAYTNMEIAQAINKALDNKVPISYDDSIPETIVSSIMDVNRMLHTTNYMPMDMNQALSDLHCKG